MDTDAFFRNVEEKHAAVIAALDEYFDLTITDADRETKNNVLAKLADSADILANSVAAIDRPKWLVALVTQGRARAQHPDKSEVWKAVFDTVKYQEEAIRKHKWSRTHSDAPPLIDFDEIVDKHRNKEVVEQLFDQLIASLEKLIACSELDSRRVVADLERLLATIRKSKIGSFHSQLLSVGVAKTYIKNLVVSWVRNTKTAKIMIEAADKTVDELGMTLDEATEKMRAEISAIEGELADRLIESAPKAIASKRQSDENSESN